MITVGAVQVPGRYGSLDCTDDKVNSFVEKPKEGNSYINGGFFVISKKAVDFIEGDETSWEGQTLKKLASKNEIMAYKHQGFWHSMDTLRDKQNLEDYWNHQKQKK